MSKIRLIASILLFLAPVWLSAQTTRVRGKVSDARTGQGIPYATVFFDGTMTGVYTDSTGAYHIESAEKENVSTISAGVVGYGTLTFPVKAGMDIEMNFPLFPDDKTSGGDDNELKLREILYNLQARRAEHDPESRDAWQADIYSKVELALANVDNIIGKSIFRKRSELIADLEDSTAFNGYIPVLLSEAVLHRFHSREPAVDKEVFEASRISGLDQQNIFRQFTGSSTLRMNFYRDIVPVLNISVPSPASSAGHLFYHYNLVDSLSFEGRKTYSVTFVPKKLITSPTFEGRMEIDAEDYALRSVHCRLSPSSNVNWVRNLTVNSYNDRREDGTWFFDNEKMFLDVAAHLNDRINLVSVQINRDMQYTSYQPGPFPGMEEMAGGDKVQVGESPDKEEAWWTDIRPQALTKREEAIFTTVERLKARSSFKVRVQLGGHTTKEFSRKVRFSAFGGYGFQDKLWKWGGATEFMLGDNQKRTNKLTVSASKDYESLGRGSGVFTEKNIVNSLLAPGGFDKQGMVLKAQVMHEYEFNPSFNSTLTLQHLRIYANPDIPLIRPDGTEAGSFSTNQIHWTGRFSWDERINRGVFDKAYIFTRYPIISVDLLGGIKGITSDDCSFFRGELTMDWRIPAGVIGFGRFHLNGGAILGSVPYPLLKLHEGNQSQLFGSPVVKLSDRTAFSMMNYYEFGSDRWLTGFYEHNFNGLLLGILPLIKRLDLREVVSVRGAWGTISEKNRAGAPFLLMPGLSSLETPYIEAGVGVANIFHLFRVDCMWKLTHRNGRDFAVCIGLDIDL